MPRTASQSTSAYELSADRIRGVVDPLLRWYRRNRRELPWRNDGDPYRVWVSEVMLQQTRVDVVVDYFARFMERFPTLAHLAQAEESEVLQMWKGLGYYSRARRLLAGARYCVEHHGGALPPTASALLGVPGIGPYSAGAISSIAFGERSPLVDGNVVRVLSRVFALRGDPGRMPLKKGLWRVAEQLVPEGAAGDFNQGLMELGALVCTPARPQCHACPLRASCAALEDGLVDRLPELPKKAGPERWSMLALLLLSRERLAVQTLPADARWWAGLDALPFDRMLVSGADAVDRAPAEKQAVVSAALELLSSVLARPAPQSLSSGVRGGIEAQLLPPLQHSVTKHRIHLQPVEVVLGAGARLKPPFRWEPLARAPELSFPAPHQKLLSRLSSARDSP